MKKNKTVKVMAVLALLGIIVSIVWVALTIIFDNREVSTVSKEPITAEKIQEMYDNGEFKTWTGESK